MTQLYDDTWCEMPCEIWAGGTDVHGYGFIQRRWGDPPRHRGMRVHVMTWEECFGPVPRGLNVLHKCDNPPCRQPLHLWLGTQADNVRDMIDKGRHRNRNYGKTRCISGHSLDLPDAVYVRKNGTRQCRACRRRRDRERYARRRPPP